MFGTDNNIVWWTDNPTIHLPVHEVVIFNALKPFGRAFGYSIPVVGKVFLGHKVCNVYVGLRVCQGTRP